jgi:tetratricopeptide (TPR) repeat protein
MSSPVFISYARSASAAEAQSFADRLGDLAFLDTDDIEDGDDFPQRLLDGVLDARVVVIFATKSYSERRFCRLEMRLALAGCNAAATQIVLALGHGSNSVLDSLPVTVADQSWPAAAEPERLAALVRQRLKIALEPIRGGLATESARKLAAAFLEQSRVPEPRALHSVVCSLPSGVAAQSIGTRFVGRADDLRNIHKVLSESGGTARLTSRITAGGGFGKTRLAVEYLHRYGSKYYPGGVFWVNAGAKPLEAEFWRVLSAIEPTVPDLATMRAQGLDIRRELERALRGIGRPTLYVVDDIPEAAPGEDPSSIADFCPAVGAVTVLATSRQDTREAIVRTIPVDTLAPEAAILLLTENVPGAGTLSWNEWGRISDWVGNLPLALDLLNRSLALSSISPRELLQRAGAMQSPGWSRESGTKELDRLREALRGQVPRDAIRGIAEAFSISFEKLDAAAKKVAMVLAQLASAPIPEAFFEALPEEWKSPGVRVALRSRHFVTSGGGLSFGVMHRLMADFLRNVAAELETDLLAAACRALGKIMTLDRCQDPRHWPVMNLCRPHGEILFTRGINRDATAILRNEVGPITALLASAQGDHASARRLHEKMLEVRKRILGEEHPDTLTSMSNLGSTFWAQGDHAGARRLHEKVFEVRKRMLGKEHPDTLTSMNNLASILGAQGDHAGARRLHEKAFEVRKRILGEEHSDTLTSMSNLGVTLGAQGDHAGARRLEERALEIRRRVLGEEHPDTLTSMGNLASTFWAQGDHSGARRLEERALEIKTRVLGQEHPATLTSMNNLAVTLSERGDHAGARRLKERALEVRTRVLGEEHPATLTSMNNLAVTLSAQGDHASARRLHEKVLEVKRRVLGEEHPATLTSMWNLGLTLLEERNDGALALLRRCLAGRRKLLGDQHPDTMAVADFLLQFENELKSTKGYKQGS